MIKKNIDNPIRPVDSKMLSTPIAVWLSSQRRAEADSRLLTLIFLFLKVQKFVHGVGFPKFRKIHFWFEMFEVLRKPIVFKMVLKDLSGSNMSLELLVFF